jgi:membrane protease YdiL (CAAX protease family)
MLSSLLVLAALLPLLGLVGIAALAAFSVLYLNGVGPGGSVGLGSSGSSVGDELRRSTEPRLPEAKIAGVGLLMGFLALVLVPTGVLKLLPDTISLAPADPSVLLRNGCGLLAAVLVMGSWNQLRGGGVLFPWGGGKLSRPVFAFLAIVPMLAVSALWNRHLVEGLMGGTLPSELISGLGDLESQSFWLSLGMVTLIGPLLEELLFRGAVFAAAAKMGADAGRNPSLFAVLFSTAAFTLVHPPSVWLPIFIFGLVLGCVRFHGHGLRDCVLLHMGYNAAVLFLTYPAS